MNNLTGKVALITGGAGGIGSEVCRQLARDGAYIIITDINDSVGESLSKQLQEKATYIHLDVQSENQWVETFASAVGLYGKVDILVNAAGVTGLQDGFDKQDPENTLLDEWDKIHSVNVNGVFLGCKYAIRNMKTTGGGRIINLSSRSGIVGVPAMCAYASSKAAVHNHTKSVALYCLKNNYNILCNSLHPAFIHTQMWNNIAATLIDSHDPVKLEEFMEKQIQLSPMKRWGIPAEVAAMVLFLCSDEASYITGAEFNVDGGVLAGGGSI